MRKKIGECLIHAGLITEADLQAALDERRRTGDRLGTVLVRMNLATETQIATALADQLGFPYINLSDHPPEAAAVALIPKETALKRGCVAVSLEKNVLTLAMADPLAFSLVQDLEFRTGLRIKQVVATSTDINQAIQIGYPDKALAKVGATDAGLVRQTEAEPGESIGDLTDRSQEAPITHLVDLIINSAIRSHASDVHVEPMEKGVLIRHRLDGMLKEVMDLPKWMHEGLVARLKVMAGIDIAEKRLPQDGRLRVTSDDRTDVAFRVSTLRTMFGEKVVLRQLDRRRGLPPLEELGLSATALEQLRLFLRHQHGMVLVVGATGSGKTTTLSSALAAIRSERTNIVTIEDPIEYQLAGINQTQINEKIKLTFAGALRSILRQDPDVILVGEIRDFETARIAMQAAQTGHLVLSTLHTDDAPSAVTRLIDIGIEPFIISSALLGVVAQRLVRRLCLKCRRPYTPDAEVLRALNIAETDVPDIIFYRAVGCEHCNQTGYRRRIALYEVMRLNEKLRRMISQRASEDAIREAALASGMVTLGEDGLTKVKGGVTTTEELLRVVTEVREMRSLCPQCGAAVDLDFRACPQCGRRLGGGCASCGRALQPGWKYCPYCAVSTEVREKARLSNERERRVLPAAPLPNVGEFENS